MTKGKKQMDGTKRCRIEFGLAAGESKRLISKEIGVNLSSLTTACCRALQVQNFRQRRPSLRLPPPSAFQLSP